MKYRKADFVNVTCKELNKKKPLRGQKQVDKNDDLQPQFVRSKSLDQTFKNNLRKPLKQLPKMNIRKVFVVLSRIHWALKLSFATLYLALEIYLKYIKKANNPEEMIPEDCLIVVSMYLAMKYQEIYPPSLKQVEHYAKTNLTLTDYKKYELQVLFKLDANLNITTAYTLIESILKDADKEAHIHAYYLLQIAYTHPTMIYDYSIDTICKSIWNIIKPSTSLETEEQISESKRKEIENCSYLLIILKQKHFNNENYLLTKKYGTERYMKVSQRVLPRIK